MHGRLKVKSTAEQQEAKCKEKEKKLQIYRTATTKIFDKRQKNEFDEEMMVLTSELLSNVPEFSTLWNIRRELMESWAAIKESAEMSKVYNRELCFLEQCLRMNPKCYSTWNQRCWIMDKMESPNWTHELTLCTKFLEYDERNFHCWDYRRFVVQHCDVQPLAELEFTSDKISTNFSNFSSWHYRSKLLPVVHPDQHHPTGVSEEALLHEFDLVQNAFFTDPNDQSAWFYHRWLLGQGQNSFNIVDIYMDQSDSTLLVTLNRQAQLGTDCQLCLSIDGNEVDTVWSSSSGEQYGILWIGNISSVEWKSMAHTFVLSLKKANDDQSVCKVAGKLDESGCYWKNSDKTGFHFSCELSSATTAVLNTELDSCRQLHDLEPDNKWVILTMLSLMRALDPVRHQPEMMSYLNKLACIDALRTNYYNDLRSKIQMEVAVESLAPNTRQFSLSGVQLTNTFHLEHLCVMKTIDLSHNKLQHLQAGFHLQSVVELNLKNNHIVSCHSLKYLPKLEVLDLSNNDVKQTKDLASLSSCPRLHTVHLGGNPVIGTSDFAELSLGQIRFVCAV